MKNSADGTLGVTAATRTDAELMADMTAEDEQALETFFRRYVRLVYRVASNILRDSGEAEDVTQEVFLEVYRKAYLYDESRGSVRVWLLQYAYHRTLRRKAALRRRPSYRAEPLEAAGDPSYDDTRTGLTRDEGRWVLRTGLALLSERQRETLELACFEELTLRDISERLDVSIGCTRHHYYRGLARLQAWARLLEGHGPRKHLEPGFIRPPSGRGPRTASKADRAGGARRRGLRLCARN